MLSFNEFKQLSEAAVPKLVRAKGGGTKYSSAQEKGPGFDHEKQKVAINTFGVSDTSFLGKVPTNSTGNPIVPGIILGIAYAIQKGLNLDQAVELVAGYIVTNAISKKIVKQYYEYFTDGSKEENTVSVKKSTILKGIKLVPKYEEYLDYAVKHN